jgi:hypothetical protein
MSRWLQVLSLGLGLGASGCVRTPPPAPPKPPPPYEAFGPVTPLPSDAERFGVRCNIYGQILKEKMLPECR